MRSLFLVGLLAFGATAAAAAEPAPRSKFSAAYQAAAAQAGKSFEEAQPFDAAKMLAPLKEEAETEADKSRLAGLGASLREMERLRKPVPAPAGPNQTDILEAAYAAQVARYAKEFKANAPAALEARRRLLRVSRGQPPEGAAGEPGKAAGPAPSEAAQRRIDAMTERRVDAGRARAIAAQLEKNRGDAGGLPADGAVPRWVAAASPMGSLRAADFAVGQHLRTGAVPAAAAPAAAPPAPEAPGLWARTKAALTTPLSGVEESYHQFAERRMAESERREQQGAKRLEEGGVANTLAAGWDATVAFGNRVAAGDKKAVTAVAVGAGVAIAAVVAAPVVAAGSVAAGIGIAVEAGVAGLTAYNVVKGTAALAREPNAANAALLAVNFAPVPFLGKIAHAAGSVAERGVVALRSAGTDSELAAGAFSGLVAIGEKFGQGEVEVLAKSAVHDMTHVAGHQAAHAMVHTAAATIEGPSVH